jgi:tetratricopeptide (TPR) repeat protein
MFARSGRRSPAALACLSGLSLMLSLAAPAEAQTDPDELARRHFESGAAYFEQAEYDAALREFQKAHELSQRPQILRNISVVEERLGNLAGAIAALDQYLAAAPNDPDVETIRIRRDNLKKRLEEESAPEPVVTAPVEPPPKEQQPVPKAEPQRDEGVSFTEDDFSTDEDDSEPNLVPAYVLITVGGLSAVGAGVTGFLASSEHESLQGSCGTEPSGCTDEQTANGETLALTSTVLTGVAVLGIGIGAILWATADSGESGAGARPALFVGVGPEGGYGRARWSF